LGRWRTQRPSGARPGAIYGFRWPRQHVAPFTAMMPRAIARNTNGGSAHRELFLRGVSC
jgi:hypothetical protein